MKKSVGDTLERLLREFIGAGLIHKINALQAEVDAAMARLHGEATVKRTKPPRGESIMAAFDDLKASVEAYIAAVDAALSDINQKIQDAIAADDAAEDSALAALKDVVEAARAKLNPVEPTT